MGALNNLSLSVQILKGVGESRLDAYHRLGCQAIKDLLYLFPTSIIDRSQRPRLNQVTAGSIITVALKILEHIPGRSRASPYRIRCTDHYGDLSIVYFNGSRSYLQTNFPVNTTRVVSGKVEYGPHHELQMAHPDFVLSIERANEVKNFEPSYPLTYALSNKYLSKTIQEALKLLPDLTEWIDPEIMASYSWQSWKNSINMIHNPTSPQPDHKAKERLAYDELLAQQFSMCLVRNSMRQRKSSLVFPGILANKLLDALPFTLTAGQRSAIEEITSEQQSGYRMLRLLQGDVGSGKTVVAFIAALNAIEAGMQVAIMVPTEILSRQHYNLFSQYASDLGIEVGWLTTNTKGVAREELLSKLGTGTINLVVGTHALFQEEVAYQKLGLVIIDEQHRFGVEQRVMLSDKGDNVDMLLLSATPIPRTLTMVNYGDMDVSVLKEKPAERQKIDTRIMSSHKLKEIIAWVQEMLSQGEKAYWLCPLVNESEKLDLKAAKDRFDELSKIFSTEIGLVHGQMKAAERDSAMQRFITGEIKLLVATTVIEVGVDVRDASIMIIEHAERFGLSQLHQLRGRVGRGDKKSYCFLLYKDYTGQTAHQRLQVIKNNDDGFIIAEEDLKIRGGGDILGTKQSGERTFKVFNFAEHSHLIPIANKQARRVISEDPELENPKHQVYKDLLQLFDYDKQSKYISFG